MIRLGRKIWIEVNGEKIFGKGPVMLLLKVDELGSLRKAAFAIDMSYTKAWYIITTIEKATGKEMLNKRIGGINGGSSKLTDEARAFIDLYVRMENEMAAEMEAIFEKYFGIVL